MNEPTRTPKTKWSDPIALANRIRFVARKWSALVVLKEALPEDIRDSLSSLEREGVLDLADGLSKNIDTQVLANQLKFVAKEWGELEKIIADLPSNITCFSTPESALAYAQKLELDNQ